MSHYSDTDTERALLSTICAPGNGHNAVQVASIVEPDDFIHPNHRMLFCALLGALKHGQEITPFSLKANLDEQGNLEKFGGFSQIVEILQEAEVEKPDVLVAIMRDNRARRQTANLAGFIAKAANNPDFRTTLEQVKIACDNILARTSTEGPVSAGDILRKAIEEHRPLSEQGSGENYAITNISWVDEEFAIAPKLVTAIGARPGVGKTTMAIQVAAHAARMGRRVQIYSLEMGKQELTGKLVSHFASIDAKWLRKNAPSRHAEDHLDALDRIQIIEGYAGYPWANIEAEVHRGKPEVVVIDYFEYIEPIKGNDKRADVGWSNLSIAITGLTKRLGISMVLLVQLHRLEEGQEPHEANVAQTDQVAKDAANLLMLFRKKDNTIWAKIAKARFGERGACRQVNFDGSKNLFSEMETASAFDPIKKESLY